MRAVCCRVLPYGEASAYGMEKKREVVNNAMARQLRYNTLSPRCRPIIFQLVGLWDCQVGR